MSASIDRLRAALASEDPRVRWMPVTAFSVDDWLVVLRTSPNVQLTAAGIRTLHAEVLDLLARASQFRVRVRVASRRDLDEVLLRLLSADRHEAVRLAIAKHRRCPPEVLATLAGDSAPDVSEAARTRLARPPAAR